MVRTGRPSCNTSGVYRLGIILKLVAARAACYIPVIGAVADIASVLRVFLDPDGADYAAAGRLNPSNATSPRFMQPRMWTGLLTEPAMPPTEPGESLVMRTMP